MRNYWKTASAARRSARLLFDNGDRLGAVNRAYYAVFDGARAALAAVDPKLSEANTHVTIIRRFGKHVVVGEGLDRDLGRIFAQIEDLRRMTDYEADDLEVGRTRTILEQMDRFLDAVGRFLEQVNDGQ